MRATDTHTPPTTPSAETAATLLGPEGSGWFRQELWLLTPGRNPGPLDMIFAGTRRSLFLPVLAAERTRILCHRRMKPPADAGGSDTVGLRGAKWLASDEIKPECPC
jgi:hypothetical protein